MRRKVTDSAAGGAGRAIGGLIALVFCAIWTTSAMSLGAPVFFGLFGIVGCCISISQIVIGLHNATAEPENRIGGTEIVDMTHSVHCKHCGQSIASDSSFCRHCGGKQGLQ